MKDLYRRYLQRCNEHRFDDLAEFVDTEVIVNGEAYGGQRYGDGLAAFIAEIPDFRWELAHLLVDGEWLSAHLYDTGTTTSGRSFRIQEFAVYRLADDRIVEVWGDLDRSRVGI